MRQEDDDEVPPELVSQIADMLSEGGGPPYWDPSQSYRRYREERSAQRDLEGRPGAGAPAPPSPLPPSRPR